MLNNGDSVLNSNLGQQTSSLFPLPLIPYPFYRLPRMLIKKSSTSLKRLIQFSLFSFLLSRSSERILIWCSCGTKPVIFELSRATAD